MENINLPQKRKTGFVMPEPAKPKTLQEISLESLNEVIERLEKQNPEAAEEFKSNLDEIKASIGKEEK